MSTPPATATGRPESPPPSQPDLITCRQAASEADLAEHHAIRRAVFVAEQQVFDASDRDAYDDTPRVVRVLGRYAGAPAGAVRLFPVDAGADVWQGDRLCVLPQYRAHGLAAPLVRCAVAGAGARGGSRMIAHIQLPNVTFFTHLGWRVEGDPEVYVGIAHQPMSIDLPAPDVGADAERRFFAGISPE